MGLVWNSMMSMAGGWFFLMISEAYQARRQGLPPARRRLVHDASPSKKDASTPCVWAMLAMVLMIVALDQLLWRPVVVWAQKFRVEEGGEQPIMSSWFLNWLRRSRLDRRRRPPDSLADARKAPRPRARPNQPRPTPLRSNSKAAGYRSPFS